MTTGAVRSGSTPRWISVNVPRGGKYSLWALAGGQKASENNYLKPMEEGPQDYRLTIAIGSARQEVKVGQEDWHWLQLLAPTQLAKGARNVTVTFAGDGVKVDTFLLTDDAQARPDGTYRIDTAAPDKVEGLAVAKDKGPHWQKLTWQAVKAADLDHYNVYAGRDGKVQAAQAYLIGSPRSTEWVDFGLKPGTACSYLVTAVDRWGNESPPSEAAQGKTDDKELYQVLVEAEAMKGGESAVVKGTEDTKFASGNACLKLPKDQKVTLQQSIDIPQDGDYFLWLKMGALKQGDNGDWYYTNALAKVSVEVDSKAAANVKILLMNRDGQGFYWTGSYLDPRAIRLRLAKGRHDLSLDIANEPWVKATGVDMVLLTNDESLWPMPSWPGRDSRAPADTQPRP
ncbi:MAG: hypothetical protein ACE15C_05215 [Phycisphaerae bacterium]